MIASVGEGGSLAPSAPEKLGHSCNTPQEWIHKSHIQTASWIPVKWAVPPLLASSTPALGSQERSQPWSSKSSPRFLLPMAKPRVALHIPIGVQQANAETGSRVRPWARHGQLSGIALADVFDVLAVSVGDVPSATTHTAQTWGPFGKRLLMDWKGMSKPPCWCDRYGMWESWMVCKGHSLIPC